MKTAFKYYLHDDYSGYELVDFIQKQTGLEFTEKQIEDIGRPFYEVTLHCILDTDTMKITIVGAE